MKKLLLILLLLVIVAGCAPKQPTDSDQPNGTVSNEAVNISLTELLNRIDNDETFVIIFEMDGCPWCHYAMPVFKEVAKENTADAYYINFSDEQPKETFETEFDILIEHLRDYIEFDNEGYPMFYVPSAYYFLSGEVVYDHTGTVDSHDANAGGMSAAQESDLIDAYQAGFDLIQ